MERVTPSDLENAEFKKSIGGYDMVQVHKLLQKAAREIASLTVELEQLRTENDKLHPLGDQSKALGEAMLAAQRSAEAIKEQAQREADRILAGARRESGRILSHAQAECAEIERQHKARLSDLLWQIERASSEKDKIIATYSRFLREQLDSIESTARKYVTLDIVEGAGDRKPQSSQESEFKTNFDENDFSLDAASGS